MSLLVPVSKASTLLSRQSVVWLIAAAVLLFALPTFRAAPAAAQQHAAKEKGNETKIEPETKPALPNIELTGKEVTPEAIKRLAGKHWGTVTLGNAKLDGTILEPLRNAASIHTLRLFGGAEVSGQIARLDHVNGLRGLEIHGPLTGFGIDRIGELTQLEELTLPAELTINVSGAREIAKLVKLKSLNMYLVNIDDASFEELRTLVRLERLDLTHTRVTDKGLRTIENMPHLKTLELDRFSFPFPKEQLTDACLPSIVRLSELERLTLSGKISNSGLVQIAKLPKLKSLGICQTAIDGNGLAALEHSSVEQLAVRAGQIDFEAALTALKKCRTLKSMIVYGQPNSLSEAIDGKLSRELPKVSIMGISN
jgi:hypothetical protein